MNPYSDPHHRPTPKLRISDLGPQELKLVVDAFLVGLIVGGVAGIIIEHLAR